MSVIIIHLICRFYGRLIFNMFTLARVVHTNCPHDAGVKVSPPKWDHVWRAPVLDGVLTPFPTALVSTNPDKNNSGFMLDPYKIIIMIVNEVNIFLRLRLVSRARLPINMCVLYSLTK